MADVQTFSGRPKSTFASYCAVQGPAPRSAIFSSYASQQTTLLLVTVSHSYHSNSVLIQVGDESSVFVRPLMLQSCSTSHLAVSIATH